MLDVAILEEIGDDYITFAGVAHKGQRYGSDPYTFHLIEVAQVLWEFDFRDEKFQAAAWLHDVLEDTDVTYVQLANQFGTDIADIVEACSGRGESRKKKQADILSKIKEFPDACIIKMADRIANVGKSIDEGNKSKFMQYKKENERFREIVFPYVPTSMMNLLDSEFEYGQNTLGWK